MPEHAQFGSLMVYRHDAWHKEVLCLFDLFSDMMCFKMHSCMWV